MNTDVLLIGSGIMSTTLGALVKTLDPNLSVQLYEMSEGLASEASSGWNNAGTGHAGICELSYTPELEPDGTVKVEKAISIYEDFEYSLQFWAYSAKNGLLRNTRDYINPVPHISLVHTDERVPYLKARFDGLSKHHFFEPMTYTEDPDEIREWSPLLVDGRNPKQSIAATKMDGGTDVNYGAISREYAHWLSNQENCSVHTSHKVIGIDKNADGWLVTVKDLKGKKTFTVQTKFLFIGGGGGSLPLLQKAGIPEVKGYGGFPVGGQWMITKNPEVVAKHTAKVYGAPAGAAPTMAVPHLDTRIIDGEKYLLFGPYASWTGKYLHNGGSHLDLPLSVRPDNLLPLLSVGAFNLDLVKYLVQQGLQTKENRMKELYNFYPDADINDWDVIDAGIRVQAIKQNPGEKPGIVHYGTEIMTSEDRSLSALLGASPGASVSVQVMFDCIKTCLPHLLESDEAKAIASEMIPNWDKDLKDGQYKDFYNKHHDAAQEALQLV
ncbi:MAG: malate dehydrogenase (quinone) [Akkermansiaceae bacterium]